MNAAPPAAAPTAARPTTPERPAATATERLPWKTLLAFPLATAAALAVHLLVSGKELPADTGKTVPQIALNWVLGRPTVSSVIIGARNEAQLRQNLGALGWSLTPDHLTLLDQASRVPKPYPYWHQSGFSRNPTPV